VAAQGTTNLMDITRDLRIKEAQTGQALGSPLSEAVRNQADINKYFPNTQKLVNDKVHSLR
jgi:hypothetical protein